MERDGEQPDRTNGAEGVRPLGPHLESLDGGLRVMMMCAHRDTINVTDVARELGCSRSRAYRLLNTLRNRGFLLLGPSGRGYFPGPVLIELARPRGLDQEDRQRLWPVIKEAVDRTGETMHVATLIGHQVLFFDGLEPDRALRATLPPGYLRPAHTISAGRLLLSEFTDAQVRELYPQQQLKKLTPWTVGTVDELIAEFPEIRRRRYAVNHQGVEVGLCGSAISLPGRSWRERVALCSTIPLSRSSPESLEFLRVEMEAAAEQLR